MPNYRWLPPELEPEAPVEAGGSFRKTTRMPQLQSQGRFWRKSAHTNSSLEHPRLRYPDGLTYTPEGRRGELKLLSRAQVTKLSSGRNRGKIWNFLEMVYEWAVASYDSLGLWLV